MDLSNLQADLDVVYQKMSDEKQKGAEQNKFLVAQLEEQEAAILAQMDETKANQSHEQRVQEAHTEIAYILDTLEAGGLNMRQLCSDEDSYQQLRIEVQRVIQARDENHSNQIRGYDERELQRDRQINNLQIRNGDLERENSRLAAWANEQETRADDAESKRDAAGIRITEQDAEIAQLKSWNDDLQLQIQRGVSGAIKVVNAEEEAKRAEEEQARIERIKAQKTIYDLKPDNDINPKNYTAKRVIDGEEVSFNWTQKNSYIVLDDPQQVLSFRSQHEANSAIPNLPLVEISTPSVEIVTPIQFRESTDDLEEPTAGTNDGAGTNAESVGLGHDPQVLAAKVATLESTVDALTADVEALKRRMAA